MAYTLSFDGPLLVIRFTGRLTPADLDAVAGEVIILEQDGTNTPHRLIDLREVTEVAVGFQELAKVAEWSRARPLASPIRSAMLVAEPVQLGYARMFQILNEHPKITMQIFEDEATAREWLAGA